MVRSSKEKFVSFVNKRIGKTLKTKTIASGTRINLRSVQQFCKSARENTLSVEYTRIKKTRAYGYVFNKPVTESVLY